MLKNPVVHEINGKEIWKFITILWRYWWIFLAQIFFPYVYYEDITIEEKLSIFIDRIPEVLNWDRCIEMQLSLKLAFMCNKNLIPRIVYSCGCSGFIHQYFHLKLDIMLHKLSPKYPIYTFYVKSKKLRVKNGSDTYVGFDEKMKCGFLIKNGK